MASPSHPPLFPALPLPARNHHGRARTRLLDRLRLPLDSWGSKTSPGPSGLLGWCGFDELECLLRGGRFGFLAARHLDSGDGKSDVVRVEGLLDQGQCPATDHELLAREA